ncbi:MAG: hypothetical protein NTX66_02820 [Candidatus Falkowbacteria bacterium]|nr:hypothetical protein [Candidatus Falkowbacteria bacterium]
MLKYLVFVGVLVQLIVIFSYSREIIRGKVKPNRITWLMWSLAPLIAAAAGFVSGVGLAVVPVFMSGFGSLLIFIISFVNKKSYWKLETFDYWCGFFSLLALILWGITKQPIVAIIFAMISDFFAAVPTLAKAWKHPETENAAPYLAGLFNALTSFAAVKMWGFTELAFPIYLILIDSSLALAVIRKKLRLNFG